MENQIGISQDFLDPLIATNLTKNLKVLFEEHKMHSAGTGDSESTQNKLHRSDLIYWLDRGHNDLYENAFLDRMDEFVLHLNSTCYTGITDYEFHYAWYEKGSFYKKHRDQFRNKDSRKFSFIYYLNDNWQEEDGGELCVYFDKDSQKITPILGKSVFFQSSELVHEVLLANKPRLSIAGWLKIDPNRF